MKEVRKTVVPRSTHFQRLYSGYGIDNPKPSEEFWQKLWEDKPRICIVDIIDSFRTKSRVESTPSVNSSKTEVDVDFTNSKKFSLGVSPFIFLNINFRNRTFFPYPVPGRI